MKGREGKGGGRGGVRNIGSGKRRRKGIAGVRDGKGKKSRQIKRKTKRRRKGVEGGRAKGQGRHDYQDGSKLFTRL